MPAASQLYGPGMKTWKCTVCGYIHVGSEPPEVCPVCHAPKSAFVEVTKESSAPETRVTPPKSQTASSLPVVPTEPGGDDIKAGLYAINYGMFVVSSRKDGKFNAQTCNTVFQVTSDPPRVAIGINKQNLTHEYIEATKVLTVTVLGKGNMKHIKRFGFQSGRAQDKFQGVDYKLSPKVGCPIIPDGVAYLECQVRPEMSVDVVTHTLYVADVVGGGSLRGTEPITYAYYRQNRTSPEELVDDVDWNNVVTSLNLEFGANRRYQYQIGQLRHPRLVSILGGIMRTEGGHVENAIKYLSRRMSEKLGATGAKGFATALLFMKLNREFEEIARATYSQFARETDDKALKDMFTDQARSEMGHINIFKAIVEELSRGDYPVMFYCPLCGWELDYGVKPAEGDVKTCPKCGAKFSLVMNGDDWDLKRIS
ncbi:MAG TPA: hypothetical protein GXX30_11420 [Firmicutes bacterium]|nr:hypothetical protein [Candidatus Fermentithermobacillaceae bacterium]